MNLFNWRNWQLGEAVYLAQPSNKKLANQKFDQLQKPLSINKGDDLTKMVTKENDKWYADFDSAFNTSIK